MQTTIRTDRRKTATRMLGIACVMAIVLGLLRVLPLASAKTSGSTASGWTGLWQYATQTQAHLDVIDTSGRLRSGDAVFLLQGGSMMQVGFVAQSDLPRDGASDGQRVRLCLHNPAMSSAGHRWVLYENRGHLEDALALMFPAEKRARLEQLMRQAMQTHGERLATRLLPVVEQSFRESLPLIEGSLRDSIERHRTEIDELASNWRSTLVEQRLVPLAKTQMLPIVRKHAEPLATEAGRELWDRASLWSFAWRGVYDNSPLPKRDLTRREWERFVAEEAVPVFESHLDDFAQVLRRIVAELAENPSIRSELASTADAVTQDPQARALIQKILNESVVENQPLRDRWRTIWSSDEVRQLLQDEGRRLEPIIRQLGDELIGSRQQGIDPGFARLLRNQILLKDQRWIVATAADPSVVQMHQTPVIELATEHAVYPRVILATP